MLLVIIIVISLFIAIYFIKNKENIVINIQI
jgi:hypothetical protein